MVLTPTKQVPLGYKAPDFKLLNVVTGDYQTLADLRSDTATVMMFICNHCPYVKHVMDGIVALANDFIPKGIAFIAISANDVKSYPDDSPEEMKKLAEKLHFPFSYLYDETQEVARAYMAECTPDFSIFDKDMCCVYRGQMDDSRPGSHIPVTGADIRMALDNMLAGKAVDAQQKPSIGCNIKWKA